MEESGARVNECGIWSRARSSRSMFKTIGLFALHDELNACTRCARYCKTRNTQPSQLEIVEGIDSLCKPEASVRCTAALSRSSEQEDQNNKVRKRTCLIGTKVSTKVYDQTTFAIE